MDPNTLGLILVAVINCVTGILVAISRRDIRKIEVATNSMKDALVAATAKASHAAGREEMRKESEK